MRYGMPYKGSKNGIANWIIDNLPSGKVLIDAFGGGGAITHCALLSKKWEKVVYNELESLVVNGFEKAVKGNYKTEKRWISREDFFKLKDTDFYVATCFSFGNVLKAYCYSKEIEPWKKAVHYARVLGDCSLLEEFGIHSDGSRSDIKKNKEDYKKAYIKWYMKKFFQNEDIDLYERLQSLESLERLETFNLSYEQLEIPDDAIVYCDIPYKNTNGYKSGFDHEAFYQWALNQKCLVFVSEYEMPREFHLVASIEKRCNLSATSNNVKTVEKLYCNKPFQKHGQLSIFDLTG